MEEKIRVLAVAGPTASGKSSLAVKLAKACNGQVISCDSMQVYMGMDIGTAKITQAEMEGVDHHLLSFVPRDKAFSVSDYVAAAKPIIEGLHNKGILPVIAGGTGLYLRSLLYGVEFHSESTNLQLRAELEKRAGQGEIDELYKQLCLLDPKGAEGIHINNQKRVLRALEYCISTGLPISSQSPIREPAYDFMLICLDFRDREKLYRRIDKRVEQMMEMGLLEEARSIYDMGNNGQGITAAQAIGCKELIPYFKGERSLELSVQSIQRETRRYAKRQLTWFRREAGETMFRREAAAETIYVDDYGSEEELFLKAMEVWKEFLSAGERAVEFEA